MIRIKSPTAPKHRILKKKIVGLKFSGNLKQAIQKYRKSLSNRYKSRKLKKRFFRQLWISKINLFLKKRGLMYSLFVNSLKKNKININRKMLFLFLVIDSETQNPPI